MPIKLNPMHSAELQLSSRLLIPDAVTAAKKVEGINEMKSDRLAAAASLAALMAAISVVPGIAYAADGDAGHNSFTQHCARCHNEKPAAGTTYGPSLVGVIGRKAGTVPGFAYSDALKGSGLVWTAESLKAWMANNDGMLPGTRMRHVGVSDATEQEQIVAYLKTLTK